MISAVFVHDTATQRCFQFGGGGGVGGEVVGSIDGVFFSNSYKSLGSSHCNNIC